MVVVCVAGAVVCVVASKNSSAAAWFPTCCVAAVQRRGGSRVLEGVRLGYLLLRPLQLCAARPQRQVLLGGRASAAGHRNQCCLGLLGGPDDASAVELHQPALQKVGRGLRASVGGLRAPRRTLKRLLLLLLRPKLDASKFLSPTHSGMCSAERREQLR